MENIDFIEPKLIGSGVWGAKIHTKRGLAFKVGESVEDIALMLGYQYGVIERKTVNEAMKPKCAVEPQKES
jgi:hypothetical protein